MKDNSPQPLEKERLTGVLEGLGAYLWWGMVTTFYFRWVREATPLELLAWRVLAGLPVILLILSLRSELGKLREILRSPKAIGLLLCSALLIMGNWLTFIYSVVEARVSEASLGYYINPLVSVGLGALFLNEKLRPLQWLAVFVAAGGVGIFTALEGSLPWISLVLAFSFALYGLIRKQVKASAEVGLAVEMILLFLPMLFLQTYLTHEGTTFFMKSNEITFGLLVGGFVTVVPLWLFARAAKKLQLTTVGLMQYIAPTAQLMVAIFYIGENPGTKWIPLTLILVALAIYSTDSIRFHRKNGNG